VIARQYDEKVDVYALGVCIYELVHGKRPFDGESPREYWQNTLKAEVSYASECPPELVGLMRKMMRKDPAERITALDVLSTPAQNR
jgi:serine/threonine protein kinase